MKKICDVFHNAGKYLSVLEKLTRLRNKKKKINRGSINPLKQQEQKFHLVKKIHNKYKFGDKCTKDSLKANNKEYNATLDRCMKNNRCD